MNFQQINTNKNQKMTRRIEDWKLQYKQILKLFLQISQHKLFVNKLFVKKPFLCYFAILIFDFDFIIF